jgi:heat shock protein HslJ
VLKKIYGKKKALLLLGVFVLCGIMLTSVDDCEEMYYEGYAPAAASHQGASQASGQAQGGTAAQTGQGAAQAGTQQASQQAAGGTAAAGAGAPGTGTSAGTASAAGAGVAAGTGVESEAAALEAAVKALSGKDWKLQELRKGNSLIEINRSKLEADGAGDFFTLAFDERVSGKAAPNRFTAPYQAGPNNTLTIQQPASTQMALIHDPERIHEKDYFLYLTNVKSWKMNQGKLELHSSDFSGKETTLVYSN